MEGHSKERLLTLMEEYEQQYGELPTRRKIREKLGLPETQFIKHFGSWGKAKEEYLTSVKTFNKTVEAATDTLVDELLGNVTRAELRTIVESSRKIKPTVIPDLPVAAEGYFKALVTGDSHIGHNKFNERWWYEMITHCVGEGVQFGWHTGDLVEGMSGRPGHIYELDAIGFEAQFEKAKHLISEVPFQLRGITGNHDGWFKGKGDMGINVGARLQEALDNYVFLGESEADDILHGVKVKLWHGNDGSSYATSYRTQKFVETLADEERPAILLAGHAHKALYHLCRGVHVFETATTCAQTNFMRGKKIAAHPGYWIVEGWVTGGKISRIKQEFNPFY